MKTPRPDDPRPPADLPRFEWPRRTFESPGEYVWIDGKPFWKTKNGIWCDPEHEKAVMGYPVVEAMVSPRPAPVVGPPVYSGQVQVAWRHGKDGPWRCSHCGSTIEDPTSHWGPQGFTCQ